MRSDRSQVPHGSNEWFNECRASSVANKYSVFELFLCSIAEFTIYLFLTLVSFCDDSVLSTSSFDAKVVRLGASGSMPKLEAKWHVIYLYVIVCRASLYKYFPWMAILMYSVTQIRFHCIRSEMFISISLFLCLSGQSANSWNRCWNDDCYWRRFRWPSFFGGQQLSGK